MTERDKLIDEALAAMKAARRLPERAVLAGCSDDMLRRIIAYYGGQLLD
jgi:hypothetical protein